jgi:hypothetical protein
MELRGCFVAVAAMNWWEGRVGGECWERKRCAPGERPSGGLSWQVGRGWEGGGSREGEYCRIELSCNHEENRHQLSFYPAIFSSSHHPITPSFHSLIDNFQPHRFATSPCLAGPLPQKLDTSPVPAPSVHARNTSLPASHKQALVGLASRAPARLHAYI